METVSISAPRHILRSQSFTRAFLENRLFPEADRIRNLLLTETGRDELRLILRHRKLLTHFYEPSTRTRLSFETAALNLGMHVLTTENAAEFSSAIKGETIEHTARVLSSYGYDAIVVRHKQEGIIDRMAAHSDVPIINAGDGKGQHPTQALLDIYTIYNEMKRIDGLTVVLGGDLKHGRTVRSLAYLLSKFQDVRIIFLSHSQFRIGDDIKNHLAEQGMVFEETDSVEWAMHEADVVYWTRTQTERLSWLLQVAMQFSNYKSQFTIGPKQMSWLAPHARLLHPMPIVWEIKPEVDNHPQAAYFRQAKNGIPVRMAVLKEVILGGGDR